MAGRMILCPDCGQWREHHARGRCLACYSRLRASGFAHIIVDTRHKASAPISRWADDGLCSLTPGWNPRRSDGWPGLPADQKRAVCHRCPIRAQCRTYGRTQSDASEVWGGQLRSTQVTT